MATRIDKSVDYPTGVVPFTRGVVPQANILVIGETKIGYIQDITENFDRPVTEQYEVGSVGVVEGLPGQPKYALTLNKTKIYGKNILRACMESADFGDIDLQESIKTQLEASGSPSSTAQDEVFQLLIHNILPFDIEIWELDYGIGEGDTPNNFVFDIDNKDKLITIYKKCWFTSTSRSISQGSVNIVETANVMVTRPIYRREASA